MSKLRVFISSVQKEFAEERKQLSAFLKSDPLMSSFFDAVFFEELPAASQAPDKIYLDEVHKSNIYILLMGVSYGFEGANGVSPTELEYECSKANHIRGFAYIKGDNTTTRHEKEVAFISKVQAELSYKRFNTTQELIDCIKASLFTVLTDKGLVQSASFDASVHPTAQLTDIDPAKVENFLNQAIDYRGIRIKKGASTSTVLAHLQLLAEDKICNSALLAFAKSPQQFFPTAISKCVHFHGYKIEKPIPDHKVFDGDVFQQVDQAVDFVLSKISVSVGLRSESVQAPIHYEIPRAVITEAIVNAIAHRDYSSNGSVQVMLFVDRLEVFNPGRLSPELTVARLKGEHASYPTNPRLAETLFLNSYIDRLGTGTGEIFRLTAEAGLKEPVYDFGEGVKLIIWRPTPMTGQVSGQATGQVTSAVSQLVGQNNIAATGQVSGQATGQVEEPIRRVILVLYGEMKSAQIQEALELKHRDYFRLNYLEPSIKQAYVEMTFPDSPKHPNQHYRLTPKGLELKALLEKETND